MQHDDNLTGMLARFEERTGHDYSANGRDDARVSIPEEYAGLHADIEHASGTPGCFVVGITSAVYGEGKTTVAMNLAATIARNSTQRVVLVDCNLRNWDLQTRLRLPPCCGLVDILEGGEEDLTNVVRKTDLENLMVVPAGRAAVNPSKLVRSPRLPQVMDALRASNEFVVADLAPVLPVADARVLARWVDGIVMVVRAGETRREIVARAISVVGTDKVLGVVLNGADSAIPRWLRRFFA